MVTRREFATMALSCLAWPRVLAQTSGSVINGVRVGVQTYSFRDLPRPADGDMVDVLVKAMTESGIRECELWSPQIEPARDKASREALRQWRLTTPLDHFCGIRKKFDAANLTIRAFNYSLSLIHI